MSPEAWAAVSSIFAAVCVLLGILIRETQETRRAQAEAQAALEQKLKVGQREVVGQLQAATQATVEARDAAAAAAAQTVTTGNGHAGRVEGGLEQVIDRLARIEETSSATRDDTAQLRKDLAQVSGAISQHLQDHAGADVRRAS